MVKSTRITICMACYNGSMHIGRQLSSILEQIGVEDEVIIVDDCSTDNTLEQISLVNDYRVKLYSNERNIGVGSTFSRALFLAQGDLIFLSDQDDFWFPEKVATIKNIFLEENVSLIVHDAVIVNSDGILSNSLFKSKGSGSGIVKNIISNTYTGCCISFRRELLEKILPIPKLIGPYHDAWIGIIAESSGLKVSFVSFPLIEWNRHGGNLSSSERRNIFLVIFERILLVVALFNRLIRNMIMS